MTEPSRDWLERLLEADAAAAAYPATPQFALATAEPGKRRPQTLRLAAAGVAIAVVAALAVVLALPESREAVADFLGLRVQGEQVEILPTPRAGTTPTPLPTPVPVESIASPITASEAAAAVGFTPEYVEGAGEPRLYRLPYLGVRVFIAIYPEFTLWETPDFLFAKGLPDGRILEEVTVRGQPAYWMETTERVVRILRPDGSEVVGTRRTVRAPTLVWRGAALTYRLESESLSLEQALAIAETLP